MESHRCLLLLSISICAYVAAAAGTYRAAVVEFSPLMNRNSSVIPREEAVKLMMSNLDVYEQFLAKAAKSGVQIIVFPEYGLTGPAFYSRDHAFPFLEQIPPKGFNPCNSTYTSANDYPITQRISCLAKKYKLVVVVSYGDVQPCNRMTDPKCPPDGRYQFNTQVAFSETGEILAKYWKTNLYYEPHYDPSPLTEPVVFDTSFGVRFGMLICFDILFARPQAKFLEAGVTDVVFSSWWVNTPALMTATQMQRAWSLARKMNLLATGAGLGWTTSGFGIYSSGNIIMAENIYDIQHNSIITADVPKLSGSRLTSADVKSSSPSTSNIDGKRADLDMKTITISVAPNTTALLSLELRDIRCELNYTISGDKPFSNETMVFFAASGYLMPLFPVTGCGLLRCDSDPDRCVTLKQMYPVMKSKTYFQSLKLTGVLSDELIYHTKLPLMAIDGADLLPDDYYEYNQYGTKFSLELKSSARPILNFSVFARDLGLNNTMHL